ncbi:MAG: transposase [Flavobacteriaceae bacterium]|nr:transposase [Flavobacteriaceae bacterium]
MKKILSLSAVFMLFTLFAQTSSKELETQMAQLNQELTSLKSSVNQFKADLEEVKSYNKYLKGVLDIQKPILEVEKDGVNYKITKVTGNKQEKTISIEMLFEAVQENTNSETGSTAAKIIDTEGNEYKFDSFKSTPTNRDLFKNVPLKVVMVFKNIEKEPKVIKMFSFGASNKHESNKTWYNTRSKQEFRDLNVTWN